MPSEYDYDEIDPLEKEWMMASAQADIDSLQRLMMTDSTLLNRKGFLHGYTALHWAAKHGRMDILSMLLLQGAVTDIKSVSWLSDMRWEVQYDPYLVWSEHCGHPWVILTVQHSNPDH